MSDGKWCKLLIGLQSDRKIFIRGQVVQIYRTLEASETNSEFKFEGFNDGRVKGAYSTHLGLLRVSLPGLILI